MDVPGKCVGTCRFSAADAKDCVPPGTGFIGDGFGGRQSLGAVAARRRRPRSVVSSLFDPASVSAAGGLADLRLQISNCPAAPLRMTSAHGGKLPKRSKANPTRAKENCMGPVTVSVQIGS